MPDGGSGSPSPPRGPAGLHLDEARRGAIEALRQAAAPWPVAVRAVLIDDLFGRLRVVLWPPADDEAAQRCQAEIADLMTDAAGDWWSGEIWMAHAASDADRRVYERAWDQARAIGPGLRVLDRHRARGGWVGALSQPRWPWEASDPTSPAIVVFYSFKGGVGRTTSLAAFAIRRARAGERVVVIDGDLDAPGVGTVLAADELGTTAGWGVVDYLLEQPAMPPGALALNDYYHVCRREAVTGAGEIRVIPAGRVDEEYLGKLARVDLEPPLEGEVHPIVRLLDHARRELAPSYILIDARAGLDDPSGMFLSGLAHLHVLFGTASEQSWSGLRLVLGRLGAERVRRGEMQSDCLLVQSMVPEDPRVSKHAREMFEDEARATFLDHYYAEAPPGEDEGELRDQLWTAADLDSGDAPHVPIAVHYTPRLAFFESIDEIAEELAASKDYLALAERIEARFAPEPALDASDPEPAEPGADREP